VARKLRATASAASLPSPAPVASLLPVAIDLWWCGHFHGDVLIVFHEMGRRYTFFSLSILLTDFDSPHPNFSLALPGCRRYEP
jgi:hypothetical protein